MLIVSLKLFHIRPIVGLEHLQHVGGKTWYGSPSFHVLSSKIGAVLYIYLHTAVNHGMIWHLKVA